MEDIPIIEESSGGYYTIINGQKIFHKYQYQNNMEIIIQSKYVKPNENVKNGDKVKIKDEGNYKPGKFGPQLEFKLELSDGSVKTYTPNTQTQINLKQEFGSDSKTWIDKPLKAWVFESIKGGDVKLQLVLTPESWDKAVKKNPKDELPTIDETNYNPNSDGQEEINVKDIPF